MSFLSGTNKWPQVSCNAILANDFLAYEFEVIMNLIRHDLFSLWEMNLGKHNTLGSSKLCSFWMYCCIIICKSAKK
jgi:hypothetical protein